MNLNKQILFTSESVGQGHPDKICDQISDAILDEYLRKDPYSRCAIETMATGNMLIIAGEASSKANVDHKQIAVNVLKKAGQYSDHLRFHLDVKKQSTDISQGVIRANEEIGAGDQGIMFGYATNETRNYMPLAITLAHEIVKRADKLRERGLFKYAKSDMKSQVTLDYTDSKRIKVDTILFSCQHEENFNEKEFKEYIVKNIFEPVLQDYSLKLPVKILINPTGRFVIGGPIGDTGLTGRKIIVDTYGGAARHGGGAFSGKDATKVDRSAAYACRYVTKNLVAAGCADKIVFVISWLHETSKGLINNCCGSGAVIEASSSRGVKVS